MFIGGNFICWSFSFVQLAFVFGNPISYIILGKTLLASLTDLHNMWEEEVLSFYKELEYQGDPELAIRFIKMLLDYDIEM